MRCLPRALLLMAAAIAFAPSPRAQAPSLHRQYGTFMGWPWVVEDPDPGHPGALIVWITGAGQQIYRYESWTDEWNEDHYFGLAEAPATLHHVFFTDDLSYGYAVGEHGEAYHLPQGYRPSDFGRSQYWRPDLLNLIQYDSFNGRELWESFWYPNEDGSLSGWVVGEGDLLMHTPDRLSQPFEQAPLPPATPGVERHFKCLGLMDPGANGGVFQGAAGSTDGIYYTLDGLDWQRAGITMADPQEPPPHPLWIWDIDFRPGSSGEGFAVAGQTEGSGEGFAFRTDDGGRTWTQVLSCRATPGATCDQEVLGSQFPPACGGPGRLGYENRDVPFATFYGVTALADGTAVAVTYGAGIRRYVPGAPGYFVNESDSIRFSTGPLWGVHSSGESVWITGQFGVVRRSDDGGRTWGDVGNRFAWRPKDVTFANDRDGWVVGQDMRILGTRNGGNAWREQHAIVTGEFSGLYLHSVAACDEGPLTGLSVVAVGGAPMPGIDAQGADTPATIMWTDNAGVSCGWNTLDWSPGTILNAGLLFPQPGETRHVRLNDVDFAGIGSNGAAHYWIAGDKFFPDNAPSQSLVLHSRDGGETWRRVNGVPDTFSARAVYCSSLDVIFLVGTEDQFDPARAYMTTNAQAATPTWTDISPISNSLRPIARLNGVFVRGNDAFAVGREGVVLRFDGTRFRPFRPLYDYQASTGAVHTRRTDKNLYDVTWPPGSPDLFICGEAGLLLKGRFNHWDQINTRTENDLEGMHFDSKNLGWFAGHQGRWGDGAILTYR